MSFGRKCRFMIILLLIGDLSTISMRAGEECLMPEWLYSVILLWKRIKWLDFTSRYALYVILCKSLEKAMQKIKPLSTYRHFINGPYSLFVCASYFISCFVHAQFASDTFIDCKWRWGCRHYLTSCISMFCIEAIELIIR